VLHEFNKRNRCVTSALHSQRGTFDEANDDVVKDASQLAVMGKIKEQLN
jgi:hypothetical protein